MYKYTSSGPTHCIRRNLYTRISRIHSAREHILFHVSYERTVSAEDLWTRVTRTHSTREHILQENIFYKTTHFTREHILRENIFYKRTHSTREHILQENIFYKRTYSTREHILQENTSIIPMPSFRHRMCSLAIECVLLL